MCVCAPHVRAQSVVSNSLLPHGLQPTRLLCPWDISGKSTGVGCHFPLQGIFPTQGLNLCLLHWQADPLSLLHRPPHPPPWSQIGKKCLLLHPDAVSICSPCTYQPPFCDRCAPLFNHHCCLVTESCPTILPTHGLQPVISMH